MTLEEMLAIEAKIYVAMAEIDYDLRSWHAWFYSPSRGVRRAMLAWPYTFGSGFRKGVRDAQAALAAFSAEVHHDSSS